METPQAQQTSRLSQWPVQIKLVPVNAPYFDGAKLLIAADCTAYAYANIHEEFMRGHVTIIGCPKLDAVDYSEKLTEIIAKNDIKSAPVSSSCKFAVSALFPHTPALPVQPVQCAACSH